MLLSVPLYTSDFESGWDSTPWSGSTTTQAFPLDTNDPPQHFLGKISSSATLTIPSKKLTAYTYAIGVRATLFLIGDISPGVGLDGSVPVYTGGGGPEFQVTVNGQTGVSANFAHYDSTNGATWKYYEKYGDYSAPGSDPHLPGDSGDPNVTAAVGAPDGFDYNGGTNVAHLYCDTNAASAAYSIDFEIPVLQPSSVTITFSASGGGSTAFFGLDDVTVNGYEFGVCQGCMGNPDNKAAFDVPAPSGNSLAIKDLPSHVGDIGVSPELDWVGSSPGYSPAWLGPSWVGSPIVGVYFPQLTYPIWFDSSLQPITDYKFKLIHDTTNHQMIVKDEDGNRAFYQDNTGTAPGRFVNYLTVDGDSFSADGSSGDLGSITQDGGVGSESVNYTYTSGKLTALAVKESGSTVRETDYTYYGGSGTNGASSGALEYAVSYNESTVTGTSYYRYWNSGDTGFSTAHAWDGAPKFVFGPQAYARLVAAFSGTAVTDLTSAQVAPYADIYYKAFDTEQRVAEKVVAGQGDLLISTTVRSTGTNYTSVGYNLWKYETDTTYADGTHRIVFQNYLGQTMLETFKDSGGSERPVMYYQYGTSSSNLDQVILTAHPSAFMLSSGKYYATNSADLLSFSSGHSPYLEDSKGLIETTKYYDTTTASGTNAGGVAGFFEQSMAQRGEDGNPIRQDKTEYYTHSSGTNVSDATIYPIAKEIRYAGSGLDGSEYGTDPRVTIYQYGFASNSNRILSRTTIQPPIIYSENGPATSTSDTGDADTSYEFYDNHGRVTWSKDGTGSISLTEYDDASGGILKQIVDVDYASLSGPEQSDYPSGWNTNHAGLQLVTTYELDAQGRATKTTDPNGNVTYVVYNDGNHEVRTYRGFDGTNTAGPIEISREDWDGSYTEQLTLATSPHLNGSGVPDGTETISAADIRSLSRTHVNAQGQADESDRYVSLASQTYATGAASFHIGSAGTNYYATTYGYDDLGRQDRMVNPLGTITRTVFDAMGRVSSTWVGTDDTPSSGSWSPSNTNGTDLTKLSESLYDTYDPAITVVGDSNLTRTSGFANGTTSAHITDFYYDWRNRQVASKSGVLLNGSDQPDPAGETNSASVQRLVSYTTYDNLGEVTQQDQYDGDGAVMVTSNAPTDSGNDGVPDAPGTNTLRARMTNDYDDQGRVWRSSVFRVDQSTGAVSSTALRTWNWYDHRGNVIKTFAPGGLSTKYAYDGAGRVTAEYMTDGGGDAPIAATNGGSWWNAGALDGDHVLEQHETQYDADGNAILMITRMRFHDAPEPGTNSGDLSLGANTSWARVSFSTAYYDAANRMTDSVDVGTNGGTAYTRPSNAPTSRSNVLLLTHDDYNDAGELETVTDPRGLASKTYYDLLGRTTKTIANYVDGEAANSDDDQITEYTYDGGDHILTMKAVVNNAGAYSGTNSVFQTTQYIYGVTTGGGNGVNSNDLLKEVRYPDKTTGSASTNAANIEAYTYDALGERKTLADRNGSTHAYSYDVLGRMLTDNVTTLGSGVDGTVRRLDYNYDTGGRAYQMTSYGNTNGTGTPINQIQYAYNGYGQLTAEYQEHGGAVNTGTSPKVQYGYSEGGTDVTNLSDDNSRLTSITYPNARVLRYEYGASESLSSRISRLSFLADQANDAASTHIEEYSYLGLSTVVIRNRPSANSKLTYVKQAGESNGDAGDQYTGLDRFGRIVDQRWIGQSGSSTTTLDRFQYGYDANSNPLYKNNLGSGTVAATFSELYHTNGTSGAGTSYDGLNRLTDFRRGTLSDMNSDGAYDTVSTLNTLAGSSKNWSLDAVGNWNSSTTGTNSAVVRTHDKQNEVTAVGGNSLTFDNAGNTTTDESGNVLTYDAWNRLVTFGTGGTNTTQTYTYDAAGRRTSEDPGTTRDLYYSNQWQVLEERESGLAKSQNVWSPTYVDELIERDRDADTDTDGTLDTSFDSDGKLTTLFGSASSAIAVAIQPDGKTVVVGQSGGNGGEFAVARYNLDGSLDSSFGTGGKVTTNFSAGSDNVYAVAIQPNGKIIVAGSSSGTRFALVRYNADGTLDSSFDGDGKLTTHVLTGSVAEEILAIAIQPDGEIVASGYAEDGTTFDVEGVVVRYDASGALDSSFDTDGIKFLSVGSDTYSVLALQPDGQILVGLSVSGAFEVERLSGVDGSLDTSFGSSGVASAPFSGFSVQGLQAMTLQADGKIVTVGIVSSGGSLKFGVARFTAAGALDTSFDSDGQVTTTIASNDQALAVRAQADGKIVVAGAGGTNFELVRYNEDGSLDTTFDGDGKVTTDFGGLDYATGLSIGPDYKITAVGWTGSPTNFAVARYKVTNSLEERLYAQTDANHNVTGVADVFGAVKERFAYDPYGAATTLTSSWASTSDTLDWSYLYQGGRYDSVAGLYSFRHRDDSPTLGRWIEQDSAYDDGLNLYQTVKSSPTARVDPTGKKAATGPTTQPAVIIALVHGPTLMGNSKLDFSFHTKASGLEADTPYFQVNSSASEWLDAGDNLFGTYHHQFQRIIDRVHTTVEGNVHQWGSSDGLTVVRVDAAHEFIDRQARLSSATFCYFSETRNIDLYKSRPFGGGNPTDKFLSAVETGKVPIAFGDGVPNWQQYGTGSAIGEPVAAYSYTYLYANYRGRITESIKFVGLQGAQTLRYSGNKRL